MSSTPGLFSSRRRFFSFVYIKMAKSDFKIFLLCFGVFLTLVTYNLIAPLLPEQLIHRQISTVYSGIILGYLRTYLGCTL